MTNPLFDTLFGPHIGSDAIFLHLPDQPVLRYGEFLQMIARFSHVISDAGLRAGDRLAIQIDKSPQALAIYGACAQTGVVFLPLNTAYTPQEVSYFITDSGAKLVICDPRAENALRPICHDAGARLETMAQDGRGSLSELARTVPETFATTQRSEQDLAAFLYTSGTTGRSKGAMLTQNNLLSNTRILADVWAYRSDDVLLHALPIFHTHGLFVGTNLAMLTGSSMIFLPKFDTTAVLSAMAQATVMMGVPTFYTRLLTQPAFTKELTRNMRIFISGSAPLLEDTHRQFETRTGHAILERYGMTETNMNTSNPYNGARRPGTVGFPLPGVELRITDGAKGEPVGAGQIGHIEVRGENVFKGYWNMPDKTAEDLRADGFFITGDLGRLDEDGYLHIVGRGKDMIISGGYNIYPKEIEQILDAQEGILETAVIGIPDPDFGEAVLALVVPEEGARPNLNEIQAQLDAKLARFKHPKDIKLIDALPRNAMGKVQKALLRKQYAT